jgi:hypothetical protein
VTPRQVIDGHAVPMLDRSMSASRGWEVVVIGMDGRGDGDGDGGLEVGGDDVQGIYIWAAHPPLDEGKVTLTVCSYRDPVPIICRAIAITTTELPNRCSNDDDHNYIEPDQTAPIHSSALPSILARSRLLLAALRFPPYVLSSSEPITSSPAPACCVSTRQTLPRAPCHAKSSGILPNSTTSLHRGLLNSLDAASPLSQWTRKQR